MIILSGFVSKGSESYTDRRLASTSFSDKIRSERKSKKYSYFYTNSSYIMNKGFQHIDTDSTIGSLGLSINVNSLEDFENSIIKILDEKHSSFKDSKHFKTNNTYNFFFNIPQTNFIYVDRIEIAKVVENDM